MKFLTQLALLVIMLSTSIAFFTRGNMKGCFGGILRKPLSMAAKDTATTAIGANKVMVFSKSKCPFCRRAKEALGELKIEYGVIELGESSTQIIRKFSRNVSQNSLRLTFQLQNILRWPTWNGGTRTTESSAWHDWTEHGPKYFRQGQAYRRLWQYTSRHCKRRITEDAAMIRLNTVKISILEKSDAVVWRN